MAEVYLSTGAFRSKVLSEIIQQCLEHGISRLELSSGLEYRPDLLVPVRATAGRQIKYLIHNYFPVPEKPFVLNLAASVDDILQTSIDFCRNAIDLAAELGAPFYSVHSGFALNLTPELLGKPQAQSRIPVAEYTPYATAYAIFAESVASLAKYAASRGIKLLIENNVVSPRYLEGHGTNGLLMATSAEIVQFMRDLNDPNLGLLVDTGHVNVTASALGFERERFIESVSPYICAFHVSSNDGQIDQNLPVDGSDWFCPLLRDFSHLPFVVEAYSLNWEQIAMQLRTLDELLA